VDSKRCWYQGSPGRSKNLLHWAKQSPPPVATRPNPAPPVPPQQLPETVDATPKVVSTVSIPAPTSEAPQMAAPLPSLPEPPPLLANHASVLLEQTKQFADDIRSQVAKKSRELAEMNER
jgi:hypothetical protein